MKKEINEGPEAIALYLMIEFVMGQYQSINELPYDEEGWLIQNSLPGATFREEICVLLAKFTEAIQSHITSDTPFDYGCDDEMIWSEIWEVTKDIIIDGYKNGISRPILSKINKKHLEAIEILDECLGFDSVNFLKEFYPHAWNDENEKHSKKALRRLHAELNYVLDQKFLNEIEQSEYFDEVNENEDCKENANIVAKSDKSLYLMKDSTTGLYKIGVSNQPKFREKTLQSEKPTISMIGQWEKMGKYEKKIHTYFAKHRIRGEWFELARAQVAYFCHLMRKSDEEIDKVLMQPA